MHMKHKDTFSFLPHNCVYAIQNVYEKFPQSSGFYVFLCHFEIVVPILHSEFDYWFGLLTVTRKTGVNTLNRNDILATPITLTSFGTMYSQNVRRTSSSIRCWI